LHSAIALGSTLRNGIKTSTVTANYLGSDAKTAEENVTTVLERQIDGTERAVYMSSQTTNNGDTTINVSFPTEMDRNTAQVLVQNNVAVAQAELQQSFPPGLKATVGLDNTLFVSASLDEACKTLMEAIALVFLVIFIFLQN